MTRFSNFIYQDITGEERDGLAEVRYAQEDANFWGFEAEASLEIWEQGQNHLALLGTADYVRATIRATDEPLPRIPPASLGGGVVWEGSAFRGRSTVRRVMEQNRVAIGEEMTPAYTMFDAEIAWRTNLRGAVHEITLQGRNLLDEDARPHSSYLKALAPMPGRDIRIMYRLRF